MAAAEFSGYCTARGIVTAVAAGSIEIELERPPHCRGCDGACRWYGEGGSRRMTLATQRAFAVGMPVILNVADRELLRAAAIVYGLPLAGLSVGALLGFALWQSDLGTAAGAGAALAAALAVSWRFRARLERHARRALTVAPAN